MTENDVGTCNWLVEELTAARIVDRERLEPHLAEFTADCPYADADAFAKHLAREGILSKYQAKRALDGDSKKLLLGAYLLVDVMGSGSLGPVYKAIGRADQKPYAVKVLPKRAWNVRLARSQVRAFGELPDHEGIVPFLDVGTAHGLHYLVWPFAEGQTLESMVREHGPLSPGEVARIGVRLAEALKVGLTRGLIHGLIKPTNVLIAPDGQAKLLDFGIGALLAENPEDDMVDTVSRAEALAHMLECAAPESIADSSKWNPAGDQYSIGCTMYFAASGRFPFPGGTFVDKIVQHQFKQPAPIRSLIPDVPSALADVIDRLMHKVPGDRYQRLEELIRELAPLATVSRVQQPTPVNIQTPPPKGRLVVPPPVITREAEPPVLDVAEQTPKRGLFNRMFGSAEKSEEFLHATVVATGPVAPGETFILHIYVHGPAGKKPLGESAREHADQARILGAGQTRRTVAFGSRIGLHLGIEGATVGQPLQEFDYGRQPMIYRFVVSIPSDGPKQSLKGRLMVGEEGRLIAQIDFVIPIVGK